MKHPQSCTLFVTGVPLVHRASIVIGTPACTVCSTAQSSGVNSLLGAVAKPLPWPPISMLLGLNVLHVSLNCTASVRLVAAVAETITRKPINFAFSDGV